MGFKIEIFKYFEYKLSITTIHSALFDSSHNPKLHLNNFNT